MAEEYCPTISAFRTHKVAKQKPAPVTVYDYYDQCKREQFHFIWVGGWVRQLNDLFKNEFPTGISIYSETSQSLLRTESGDSVRHLRRFRLQ